MNISTPLKKTNNINQNSLTIQNTLKKAKYKSPSKSLTN